MRRSVRTFLGALLFSAIGALSAAAPPEGQPLSPSVGRWKLNVAKSKADPTPIPKGETRLYEDWGGGLLHAIVEGVDSQDKPVFREFAARYDGRDYPWVRKGSSAAWTIALQRMDALSSSYVAKEDGHVSQAGTTAASPDGKVLTLTYRGTNLQGQPVGGVLVFDRIEDAAGGAPPRSVGFLYARGRPDPVRSDVNLDAFVTRLGELGFVEGRNLSIDWRFSAGQYEILPAQAAELTAKKVEVIVTSNLPSTTAAQRATSSIPIVFASMIDPVGTGVVKSLSSPGGNVTGTSLASIETVPKQVELVSSLVPGVSRIAVLVNPDVSIHAEFLKKVQATATPLKVEVLPVLAKTPEELDRGFAAMAGSKAGAVIVPADSFFAAQRARISQLALANRIAAACPLGEFADAGCLFSYGPDFLEYYRRAAENVARILRGTKTADMPIGLPTKLELILNMKTAKVLGLSIPATTLQAASRRIE